MKDEIMKLSLADIYDIDDKSRRKKLFEIYKNYIISLKSYNFDYFIKNFGYLSIEEFNNIFYENLSTYYNPGQLTILYPYYKIVKVENNILCDLTNEQIMKGERCIRYRPLLQNLNDKKVYVLKRTLNLCEYLEDFLPTNIVQFEELNQALIYNLERYKEYDIGELKTKYDSGLTLKKLSK